MLVVKLIVPESLCGYLTLQRLLDMISQQLPPLLFLVGRLLPRVHPADALPVPMGSPRRISLFVFAFIVCCPPLTCNRIISENIYIR